jgi:hypothetical protein
MRELVRELSHCNGGWAEVNGRGVKRRKLSADGKLNLAINVALGSTRFRPSIEQTAQLMGVPLHRLEQALHRLDDAHLREKAKEAAAVEAAAFEAVHVEAASVNAEADQIVGAWSAASAEAREVAIRLIGPAAWNVIAGVVA